MAQSVRSKKVYRQGTPDNPFDLRFGLPDGLVLVGTVLFLAVVLIYEYGQAGGSTYLMLKSLHFHLSRYGLGMALAMLVLAFVLGIIRKDDVTPWFRRGTYVVFGSMVIQTISGFIMLAMGGVPGAPEHVFYGVGTMLCLPFFIFVEVTASKRPSMGSYIWGFFLMVGVIVRCFGTGPSA
jgi:hypothetical protein